MEKANKATPESREIYKVFCVFREEGINAYHWSSMDQGNFSLFY